MLSVSVCYVQNRRASEGDCLWRALWVGKLKYHHLQPDRERGQLYMSTNKELKHTYGVLLLAKHSPTSKPCIHQKKPNVQYCWVTIGKLKSKSHKNIEHLIDSVREDGSRDIERASGTLHPVATKVGSIHKHNSFTPALHSITHRIRATNQKHSIYT